MVQELGVEEKMFIRVHTFGKALACHGGLYIPVYQIGIMLMMYEAIVLCCPDTRDYLINYARSLIYTTALGFPFLAAIRAVYELLSAGETEPVCHSSISAYLLLTVTSSSILSSNWSFTSIPS